MLSLVSFTLPADLVADELYDLARMYSRMVARLQAWQVQIAEIWNTIRRMLFKTVRFSGRTRTSRRPCCCSSCTLATSTTVQSTMHVVVVQGGASPGQAERRRAVLRHIP